MPAKNDYTPLIAWFKQVDKDDLALVGGKGANLGEMYQAGLPVPPGFIITAKAYHYLIDTNHLQDKFSSYLKNLDSNNPQELNRASAAIKQLIFKAAIPEDLINQIFKSYLKLSGVFQSALVAVRSSATAEDLPGASFAGQQTTFLNVKGEANLIQAVRGAWASLFEPRAIFYREQKGFDHFKVALAVPVQKMVQSDISGVMFTINPVTGNKQQILIEAIWGLGEKIVQGAITPDRYIVDKTNFKILQKILVEQRIQLIKKGDRTLETSVPKTKQRQYKLTDHQLKKLAQLGKKIHQHYFFPQDIEWALEKGHLYVVQTRPVTALDQEPKTLSPQSISPAGAVELTKNMKLILQGDPASPGIATGLVKVIYSAKKINQLKPGDILVTTMTTPDFVPAMRKVVAIITEKGGQTSHAAIVSRELGIPCIVGASGATKKLKNNRAITVNARSGEIFAGALPTQKFKLFQKKAAPAKSTPVYQTATKLYVNLAEPELAVRVARKNVDGVGLLRAEFMIADIGVHPRALIKKGQSAKFISQLSHHLETFASAFNPRPVVYRTTDFKTNEYRHLKGGEQFEAEEPNPMLGFRGAYRYLNDPEVFELELAAIRQVRNQKKFRNLWLMLPFVHSANELIQVKRIIAAQGLVRSPSFKLWLMVELPANVILLEDFIKVGIDGVSVGTNDLTMLLLGVDRDNEKVSSIFNEESPAVLWALERVIKICHQYQVTSSVCGQAPSNHPSLVQKLVKWGITSISVNPDVVEQTRQIIYHAEKANLTR